MRQFIHFCTKVCVAVCCELWLCHNDLQEVAVIATIILLAIELKLFIDKRERVNGD
jgi:hypothetical protein